MSPRLDPAEARVVDCLERALALAGGTHDFQSDVVPRLLDGRAQYWQRGAAAIVTEIHHYPRCRDVNYWLVGGRLADALALVPEIEAWARTQGATRAVAFGRKGWAPVLGRLGWQVAGTGYRKQLVQ